MSDEWTPAQQLELQQAILDDLSLPDLQRIARYGMNQDFDQNVRVNGTPVDQVFDWLEFVRRKGDHELFVRMAYVYRPENPRVLAFCTAHAAYVFTPTPEQQAYSALVRVGELGRASGAVRGRVREATEKSDTTLRLLARMAWYKQLHDVLHSLDYGVYPQLKSSVARLRADPPRFRTTADEVQQLRQYCGRLDQQVRNADATVLLYPEAERAAEVVWVDQLRLAAAPIRRALDPTGDPDAAADGVDLLHDVLSQQPSYINRRIFDLAGGVDLPGLARHLREATTELPPADAAPLAGGLNDLTALGPQITALVDEHSAWQVLDNPVSRVAGNKNPKAQLALMWPQIASLALALVADYPGVGWGPNLATAVAGYNAPGADHLSAFDDLRQVAGARFRAVDVELLRLTTILGHVAENIRTAAQGMNGADH